MNKEEINKEEIVIPLDELSKDKLDEILKKYDNDPEYYYDLDLKTTEKELIISIKRERR